MDSFSRLILISPRAEISAQDPGAIKWTCLPVRARGWGQQAVSMCLSLCEDFMDSTEAGQILERLFFSFSFLFKIFLPSTGSVQYLHHPLRYPDFKFSELTPPHIHTYMYLYVYIHII